jgi:fructose-bisphosphate aldolase class 1
MSYGLTIVSVCGRLRQRFEKVGVQSTEDVRRAYRQMLFEAEGAPDYVSGAILDPETVFQSSSLGVPLPQLLTARGILPGVKPSLTVYKLPGCDGETVMQGLDSLAERLRSYKAAGCVFAKWRSPLNIDIAAGKPSQLAMESNMRDQARYALICQSEGIVPIVEPDLVLTGSHTLEDAVEVRGCACTRACTRHGASSHPSSQPAAQRSRAWALHCTAPCAQNTATAPLGGGFWSGGQATVSSCAIEYHRTE